MMRTSVGAAALAALLLLLVRSGVVSDSVSYGLRRAFGNAKRRWRTICKKWDARACALAGPSLLQLLLQKRVCSQMRWLMGHPWFSDKTLLVDRSRLDKYRGTSFVVPKRNGPSHPHARKAAERRAAHRHLIRLVDESGLRVYEVSFSARSHKRGWHLHFMPRDISWNEQVNYISSRDAIVMIDVDYYLDMNYWMDFGKPIYIYSCYPESLCGADDECSWSFDGHLLRMDVKGGGTYSHPLHRWEARVLSTPAGTFQIEPQRVSDTHILVGIFPIGPMTGEEALEKLSLEQSGNYISREVLGKEGLVAQVLNIQTSAYTEISKRVLCALEARYKASSVTTIGELHSVLKQFSKDASTAYLDAANLYGYLEQGRILQPPASFVSYAVVVEGEEPHGADRATATVSCPVSTPPCAPTKARTNDTGAVVTRLENIRNVTQPEAIFAEYAKEFVTLSARSVSGPYLVDDVLEFQSKKIQRVRNLKKLQNLEDDDCRVDAFVKAEFYAEDKDPRNISNVSTRYQIELSRYTYAVKREVLSSCHWYMPGRSLEEIALEVVSFCAGKPAVAETDFSRFDGTISEFLRKEVEFAFYKACLKPADWNEFIRLAKQELNPIATAKGRRYEVAGSRLSGSPLTTDGNTLIGAYVDYCGNREEGLPPEAAYAAIGLHFGDDGVSLVNKSEEVSARLGLTLKLSVRGPGEPVGFLGRLFVDPSDGPASLQEPARVWPKLCATLNGAGLPELRAKWEAYLRSDSNTPILSHFLKRALQLTPGRTSPVSQLYLNTVCPGQWPQRAHPRIAQVEAEYLNYRDGYALMQAMSAATSLEQLCAAVRKRTYCGETIFRSVNSLSQINEIDIVRRHNVDKAKFNKSRAKKTAKAKPARKRAEGGRAGPQQ